MNLSSNSDSDSDREPNSHGARVFWGNLKTPERSRSKFVNPPQTVVKPQHSGKATDLSQMDYAPDREAQEAPVNEDNDDTPNATRLRENMSLGRGASIVDMSIQGKDMQQPDADAFHDLHESTEPDLLTIPSPQSLFTKLNTRLSDAGSESEVEDAAVLQLSSPTNVLVDGTASMESTEARDSLDDSTVARSNSLSPMVSSWKSTVDVPQISQLPDPISFGITMATKRLPTDTATESPPQSDTAANQPTASSSYASADGLLVLSDKCFLTPSPSTSHLQYAGPHHTTPTTNPLPSSLESGSIQDHISTDAPQLPSERPPMLSDRPLEEVVNVPHPNEPSSLKQSPQPGSIQHEVEVVATLAAKPDFSQGTQKSEEPRIQPSEIALTHTPGAETRKRKARHGKAKADDGADSSGESSNTSNEGNRHSNHRDETPDKVIKKERRAKLKQETERRRPLLMSLSPTSADVLDLLASPGRESPFRSPSPPLGGESTLQVTNLTIPTAGPSSPARRVPNTLLSPRLDSRSFRLDPPAPVHLDDPNRTPARRIPRASSSFQVPRALPLDDPNRTPARRVPAAAPSTPTNRTGAAGIPRTPVPVPVASSSTSPAKSTSDAFLQVTERPKELNTAALSEASSSTKLLPFPITQQQSRLGSSDDTSKPTSRQEAVNSPSKPAPSDTSLRQPSSITVSKIARGSVRPYARPTNLPSKLPKPTARLPVSGTSFGPAIGSSQAKANVPSTTIPTRIPSPVKRQLPSVDIRESVASVPDSSMGGQPQPQSTTYKRKRQMMSEDGDSDEPPSKRPTIVVRQVRKGMFKKAAPSDPVIASSSTSHREISPMRHTRPPGPLRIRPVIPGTLGYFETTRSSSRDLPKNTENGITAPADSVLGPPTFLRDESPLVDTDTGSTVTTLSREPTLEDIPSSSGVGHEPSFATLAETGTELRRTTRARKTSGPDAKTTPSSSTRHEPLPLTRTTTMVQRSAPSSSRASKSTTRIAKTPGIPTNQRQLQALTQANTVRNQVYIIADLHRQIVRKEGPRPASPTTKVRTILEKAKEASAKGREARAERRRRRGEGSGMSTNSEGDSTDFNDIASSSPPRELVIEVPTKHVRGPGDDEDYETPVRVSKPSRLNPEKSSKNVKWDRGLARSATEFAAEQAAKQTRESTAEAEAIRKGCLARDAKSLRLDPLGNVPEANMPLDNLGQERVIITRFIYDDDEDIEASRAAKKKKS